MSIKSINSPSNRGNKRNVVISDYRSPDMGEVCTRQSTGQSFEWYEHVLTVNNTKVT